MSAPRVTNELSLELPVPALRVDGDGVIVDCNAPFSVLTGHTVESLRGRRASELMAPCVRGACEHVRDGRYPVRAADGHCVDLVWTGAPAEELGGGVLVAMPPQVPALALEEDQGFAPEPCLRLLVEHAADGVAIIEPLGLLRYVSPATRRVLGYDPRVMIGKSVFGILHPDDRSGVRHLFEFGRRHPGRVGTHEARFLHADQSWRTLSFTGRWLTDKDVGQAMVVNFHDVTELHEGARERERLVDAIAAAHDGIAFTDRNDRFVFANEAYARIHGHDRSWFLGRSWYDVAAPGADATFESTLDRTLRNPAVGVYQGEQTIVHDDGSRHLAEVTARGLFDDDGQYQGHICVVRDVTAQQADRARSHRQAQILAQIHEAVVATDVDGTISAWNRGAEQLFGLAACDTIGRPIGEVVIGPGSETFARWTAEALLGGLHTDNLDLEKPSGECFWALTRRSALRLTDGTPCGVIWTLLDVSSQREAERALEQRLKIDRTVASVSASFVGVLDEQDFERALRGAVEAIASLTGANRASFFEVTREGVNTRFAAGSQQHGSGHALDDDARTWLLTNLALGEALCLVPTSLAPDRLKGWLAERGSPDAIFLPVCVGESLVAIVLLESIAEPAAWSYDALSLLMVAIDVLGQAIERRRALRAERVAQREAASLHSALAALTSELDLEQVLARIMELFAAAMPGEGVALLLSEDDAVRVVDARGAAFESVRGARVTIPRRPASDDATTGDVDDVSGVPSMDTVRYSNILQTIPLESWLEAPLRSRGHTIGFLVAISDRNDTFGRSEAELARSFATQAAVAIDNARLFQALESAARTDALTLVANRRHILERSASELSRAQRYGTKLGAIMIDVDHFKHVNDSFGHAVGDTVLVAIAHRCRDQLRATDEIGRYGGEEFVVILPEADLARAIWVAERLRLAICGEPITFPGGSVDMTLSLGVAGLDTQCLDLDGLLRRADEALYAAKRAGRNVTCVWRRADIQVCREGEARPEAKSEQRS